MVHQELLDQLIDELTDEIKELRKVRLRWRHKSLFFKYSIILLTSLVPILLGLRAWVTRSDVKEGLAVASFVIGAVAACLNTIDSGGKFTEMYVHYCKSLGLHEMLLSDIRYQQKKGLNAISERMADNWHGRVHDLKKMTLKVWSERTTRRREDDHETSSAHEPSVVQEGVPDKKPRRSAGPG